MTTNVNRNMNGSNQLDQNEMSFSFQHQTQTHSMVENQIQDTTELLKNYQKLFRVNDTKETLQDFHQQASFPVLDIPSNLNIYDGNRFSLSSSVIQTLSELYNLPLIMRLFSSSNNFRYS